MLLIKIVKLADDKEVQAIVVSTDQAGLLPALQKVKEKASRNNNNYFCPYGDDKTTKPIINLLMWI